MKRGLSPARWRDATSNRRPLARERDRGKGTAVPFPLSLSRAKGRRFDVASRQRAGLSPRFIDQVKRARSSTSRSVKETRTRPARQPNSDVER